MEAKTISIVHFIFVLTKFLQSVDGEQLVPCYFIFGDSLFDNGNNNNRNTVAKANYLPYGIDFPGGPTGRFTNGRNTADFIAELLGFPDYIPPFSTATGNATLHGVNYASGGAGILRTTGKQFGDLISLDEQLQNHETTMERVRNIVGDADSAMEHLSQCIYSVGMGSNDYIAYAASMDPLPEPYAELLITQYGRQLRRLYSYGARKVVLFGLGTLACVPAALSGRPNNFVCETASRFTSGLFNAKLKTLVDILNSEFIDAKFIYVDTFGIVVSDPGYNAFKVKNIPCCVVYGAGSCIINGPTCGNRADFEFFDGVHPTENAAGFVARRAFTAHSPSDAYPYDIQHLAQA